MGSQSHIAYVHYRIQNVDFTTYLELYNINDPTKVVLRPSKSKLVQQVIGTLNLGNQHALTMTSY